MNPQGGTPLGEEQEDNETKVKNVSLAYLILGIFVVVERFK